MVHAKMQYRPDIDGLRALAVVPVVLYHADVPGPSGGFVGVDVFFLISGFLITSIVVRELAQNQFSLINFYERRARRILPALAAVVTATWVAGWFLMLPAEFRDLGESTVATALFAANIYFNITLDYFAAAADFAPLLHNWSLAVEEQFYIVFPLLLALIFRWRGQRTAFWVVAALSLVSLIAAVIALPLAPQWVFYQIMFRAWELGAGAMLALAAIAPPKSRLARELLGAAGLTGILFAVFAYDENTSFPGLAALPPVIGAILLIHVGGPGGGSTASRLLSLRVMVWTGLISYSLYLWHWPILAFLRLCIGSTTIPLGLGLGAAAAAVAAAWLSWRFIEQPFRKPPPHGFGRASIFALSGAALTAMIGAGLALYLTNGLPQRLAPEAVRIAQAAQDRARRQELCMNTLPDSGLCDVGLRPQADPARDFLVWGDSHAGAFMPGIDAAAAKAGVTGLDATRQGCAPLLGVVRVPEDRECMRFTNAVWALLASRDDLGTVILSARWALVLEGRRYPVEWNRPVRLRMADGSDPVRNDAPDNAAVFEAGLRQTVAAIRATGREIVLLGPTPEVPWNVPGELARAQMLGRSPEGKATMPARLHQTRAARTQNILRAVAAQDDGVRYIALDDLLCDAERCRLADATGLPLYIDDDHLTNAAALTLLPPRLAQIWQRQPLAQP